MSVIYDALKKVDGNDNNPPEGPNQPQGPKESQEPNQPQDKKKLLFVIIGTVVALVVIIAFGLGSLKRLSSAVGAKIKAASKDRDRDNRASVTIKHGFTSDKYTLEGLVSDERGPIAVVNGHLLHVGEKIDGMEVVDITSNSVALRDPASNITQELYF